MGGSEEEEEHPGFFGGGVLGVGSASHSVNIWTFELILLFTRVDGLFCLGPRETITTVQWRHSTATQKNNYY